MDFKAKIFKEEIPLIHKGNGTKEILGLDEVLKILRKHSFPRKNLHRNVVYVQQFYQLQRCSN